MTQHRKLRQRSDYTQKFNIKSGRHGWLRLTPAYSVKVVEELLQTTSPAQNVLDPFCGTGTTLVCAANRGHTATTIDINPFLVWLAQAKSTKYSDATINQAHTIAERIIELTRQRSLEPAAEPPIYRIDRWWSDSAREFLCLLKSAIDICSPPTSPVRDLLYVAFCRTLIGLSFASFNHQSMSFKHNRQIQRRMEFPFNSVFSDAVITVLDGAKQNPAGQVTVIKGDARNLESVVQSKFDIVITSPPYANRMSYIRELRPYMYWLGYLENGRDAGELDWQTIGGTWGIATSRLTRWTRDEECWLPKDLTPLLQNISRPQNANGTLLANYVSKYCTDMSLHFSQLKRVLRGGARVHYIVGNSTFYGVVVPTQKIYAALLRHYGFEFVTIRPIRKRNSNKNLIEFDVSGVASEQW